jgi:hypothetical protein
MLAVGRDVPSRERGPTLPRCVVIFAFYVVSSPS